MRRLIIAGNWKMNGDLADAEVLATMVVNGLHQVSGVETVLCPPSVFLYPLSEIVTKSMDHISLGAQNMFYAESGAYTGEISPSMIKKVCRYVIIGHSERRQYFGEDSELINDKVQAAIDNKIIPILCVGEIKKTAESYKDAAKELKKDLKGISKAALEKIVVAYEPVWAIGIGRAATPEYAAKVITLIREELGSNTAVLYGGSVDAKNISGFVARPEIDGALVGGASLRAKEFIQICELAVKAKSFNR